MLSRCSTISRLRTSTITTATRIVDVTDQLIARNNATSPLTVTRFLNLGTPPEVDLNGANDGTDFTTTWTNASAVNITDTINLATVIDDGANLISMTATITAVHAGDLLSANTSGTSVSASYDSGTGMLTLSGNRPIAEYQAVLRTIKYHNTDGGPNTDPLTVEVVPSDAQGNGLAAVATIHIDLPPVVDLNGERGRARFRFDLDQLWRHQYHERRGASVDR